MTIIMMMIRYHHVTVLIYCWYSFSEYTAPARWFVMIMIMMMAHDDDDDDDVILYLSRFVVMNFIVHSIMYSYYALRAMRFIFLLL